MKQMANSEARDPPTGMQATIQGVAEISLVKMQSSGFEEKAV